ncbi:MAG: ACT domain-containing protein [Euryarchaeota archaeon]|nr:ACT domain-containing protein [Euryarchaeota archaeon]
MRVSLDLELKDEPGQLLLALEPISKYGGNVISIIHLREEEKLRAGRVPVHFTIDVPDEESLERMVRELEERGVRVTKLGEVTKKERITLLMIGHVVDTDLRDTIDRINELEGVMVSDLSLAMPHPEKESSAIVDIEVSATVDKRKVMERVYHIAREKDLEIVRSLEV